ncbi:MAG: twin-arginine translocase subunit TatC [bacterium]|nr:twin-arginine translocase subunit TatC [bacterium]
MPKPRSLQPERENNLTFFDHLEELRKRILIILFFFGATWLLLFAFFNQFSLFQLFTAPLLRIKQNLFFQNLLEPFMVRMKISFVIGLILNIPVILFHLLKFIFPALRREEKNVLLSLMFLIVLLFFTGVFFAYKVMLPYSISFLIRFAGRDIKPLINLKEYINLYLGIMIATGMAFLFPVLILFLNRLKLVTYHILWKRLPEAVIVILVMAAVLTPPDVFSQILLTIPLFLLYFLSIGLAYLFRVPKA